MTGEDMELEKTESFLKQKFKLAVETGNQLSFSQEEHRDCQWYHKDQDEREVH